MSINCCVQVNFVLKSLPLQNYKEEMKLPREARYRFH